MHRPCHLNRHERIFRISSRRPRYAGHVRGRDDLSIFEPDQAVGCIKITVIVRDDDEGFSLPFQVCQQFLVEEAPKCRVLLGSPFIKDHDRTILEIDMDEREPLALDRGEIGREEIALEKRALVSAVTPLLLRCNELTL